ncbi:MAG: hypothetical protein IKV08_03620 [Phascolarctobacterium sp.]|nr:hypothetical protein [Phascolarctobacterium sp.]
MKNNLLTIKEFAAAAGVSTQAIYKRLATDLQPYLQIVANHKMLDNKALKEVFNIESCKPIANDLQPIIQSLQEELKAKNAQIEALQLQNSQLTTALENTTASLQAAQALHAATIQQQALPEHKEEEKKEPKARGLFAWFRR